ncbi:MAG: hypothetical protein DRJ42_01975 [Deltaproteobacteria bacterium]|nr:MAG: hypothetical protein DRJ42_01975 [Deltaproteobacteria bacterium]
MTYPMAPRLLLSSLVLLLLSASACATNTDGDGGGGVKGIGRDLLFFPESDTSTEVEAGTVDSVTVLEVAESDVLVRPRPVVFTPDTSRALRFSVLGPSVLSTGVAGLTDHAFHFEFRADFGAGWLDWSPALDEGTQLREVTLEPNTDCDGVPCGVISWTTEAETGSAPGEGGFAEWPLLHDGDAIQYRVSAFPTGDYDGLETGTYEATTRINVSYLGTAP